NILHVLITCTFARRFWFSSPWQFLTGEGHWKNFRECLDDAAKVEILEKVSCMLWHLWKHHNNVIFGEHQKPWEECIAGGIRLAEDYKSANMTPLPSSTTGEMGRNSPAGEMASTRSAMAQNKL
ncbi:hypothetical protein Leryth_016265, partial [Lithospermum erythrorhizon]